MIKSSGFCISFALPAILSDSVGSVSSYSFYCSYPLLYKAVTDNDTPISGYTYEEIAKISFQSQQHRIHLVEFFLSRLSSSGWSGKQKAVRALLHLCKKGHYGIRQLVRRRDGDLREAASMGGPPDPVLANTPQLFFNSSIQELLSYIFDQDVIKMDEDVSRREGKNENFSSSAVGYGSSSLKQGKYEGLEVLLSQSKTVFDMVGKVVTPEARKREELANFLKDEKGNYEPFHLSNANLPFLDTAPEVVSLHRQFSGPPLYKSKTL
ncbi:AP-4 complex accessory subunit tepsin [Armadillidium vulgare]|nr:AP-4 complex accessory subunit tepsin [Armadillidium vulgare]